MTTMMKKLSVVTLLTTAVSALTGCSAAVVKLNLRGGENASYYAENKTPRNLYAVQVVGLTNFAYFDSDQAANDWRPSLADPRSVPNFGGDSFFADTGHKVPEEVLVSWREESSPGGKENTGELKGPYRIKMRERIPAEVLRLARKHGFRVSIAVLTGELPIRLNWQLERFHRDVVPTRTENLCMGGDWFTDPNDKVTWHHHPENRFPIWPHCKLP
ncbi:hypothetical protein HNP55_001152 [Paucibacter oligotrophus]|uniref:Lipoprotein n=1 Tax=Roseateles oligotrophus TaxID=1769250 RepID=A0A840LBC0_9BURK|nr:hypothetical protein [Roseateles oligotrophus]MBB4842637.1 hypothetical protein [Roseateles oligotrophus]